MGWVVKATLRPYYSQGRDSVLVVEEVGWATESMWTGAGNIGPTGVRYPDLPDHSESLY